VAAHGDAILPLSLDVTDKAAATAAVQRAHDHFGRLDVVVNNAGYGLFGTVEESTEQQVRDQMETNFSGALWVTQAAPARPGRSHRADLQRRRCHCLPQPRCLQRLQVGSGGHE
jgi:NAD(P)-dependent dehydrogenase (short-subunit alcohol dehydrogenase family)